MIQQVRHARRRVAAQGAGIVMLVMATALLAPLPVQAQNCPTPPQGRNCPVIQPVEVDEGGALLFVIRPDDLWCRLPPNRPNDIRVTFGASTKDGTAQEGADYRKTTRRIEITSGPNDSPWDPTYAIEVPTYSDGVTEDDETVIFRVSGFVIGGRAGSWAGDAFRMWKDLELCGTIKAN